MYELFLNHNPGELGVCDANSEFAFWALKTFKGARDLHISGYNAIALWAGSEERFNELYAEWLLTRE